MANRSTHRMQQSAKTMLNLGHAQMCAEDAVASLRKALQSATATEALVIMPMIASAHALAASIQATEAAVRSTE